MNQWNLRDATLDDLDAVIRLRIRLWEEAGMLNIPGESQAMVEPNYRYLKKGLENRTTIIALAEDPENREILSIGIGSILEKPPVNLKNNGKEGYIFNMHTRPDLRSRGLGKAILDRIIEFFKSNQVTKITLSASEKAVPLYLRAGFQPCQNSYELKLF